MREIKFRAWNKFFSEMMYDGFSVNANGDPVGYYIEPDFTPNTERICGEWRGDTSMVLMQYTGLKDKNGGEIYEGDILEWPLQTPLEWVSGDGERAVIEWDCERLRWDMIFYSIHGGEGHLTDEEAVNDRIMDGWVVIGNIYENSELLEKP